MLLGAAGCGSCQVSVVVRVSRWCCGSVVEQAEVALGRSDVQGRILMDTILDIDDRREHTFVLLVLNPNLHEL